MTTPAAPVGGPPGGTQKKPGWTLPRPLRPPGTNGPAEMASISPEDLRARMESGKGPAVIDVRDAVEFASVRVAGTVNIPLDELEKRAGEVQADEMVVMDHGGGQSLIAGRVLQKAGRGGASRLDGGLLAWQQKG